MSLNPWIILGVVLAFIAVAGAGYAKGRADGAATCAARISDLQKASQAARDNEAARADTAARDLEKDRADAHIITRDRDVVVTKIVERPVYRNRCLDDDGVSVANAALAGARAAAGEPRQPVP